MHPRRQQPIATRVRAAFTLIELLVVISVIAILAAILFPVFALAKSAAKRTADLSNIKQMGLAVAMYDNDFDDLNPQQCGKYNGNWGVGSASFVPANFYPGYPNFTTFSESYVLNAILPYVRSYQVMQIPGAPTFDVYTTLPPGSGTPMAATYTFNGLLTSYPSTAIAAPSQLPLFTELNGFANTPGLGYANPMLYCADVTQGCTYAPETSQGCAPGNGGQAGIWENYANAGYWINGTGANWTLADGHARWRTVGGTLLPNNTDWKVDPMTGYNSTGNSYWYWVDSNYCFPYLFRPDFDFNFATG